MSLNRIREIVIRDNNGWHQADDNLGPRRVMLDGKEVTHVVRCNPRLGIIDAMVLPIRLDKRRKKVRTRRLHGTVQVDFA